MNKIGVEKFNLIFGRSITQLVITKWLYSPFKSKSKNDNPENPPELTLIANGDVNFDGGFSDDNIL